MDRRAIVGFLPVVVAAVAFAAGPVAELYPTHLTLLNDFDDGTLKPAYGGVTSPSLASQYCIGDGGVLGTKALVGGEYYFNLGAGQKVMDTTKPGTVVMLVKLVEPFDPVPETEPGVTHFVAQFTSKKRLLLFRQDALNWGAAPMSAFYELFRDDGSRYVARADDYGGSLKKWTAGDWHLVVMTHTPDMVGVSVDGAALKESMTTERMGPLSWRVLFRAGWGTGNVPGRYAIDDCAILNFRMSDEQIRELHDEYRAILAQRPATAGAPFVTDFKTVAASATAYSISATVTNPAATAVSVKFAAQAKPVNSQPASTVQVAELAPGEARTFALTGPVLGEEKVTADVAVASADGGATYFCRHRVFAPNAPEPEWMRDPSAMSFKFAYYPSTNTIHAAVDVSFCEDADEATAVRLQLLKKPLMNEIASCEREPGERGTTEIVWRDVPDLADGEYVCRATVDGVKGALADQAFVRHRFAWEGNRLGLSETVPAPFEPVKVSGEGEGRTVSVVLRDHVIGKHDLWNQVTAAGKELLARPMRLVSANDSTIRQFEESTVSSSWDVDGLCEWKLTLAPGHYEPLSLEIPIRAERATLYHACTDGIRINKAGALTNGIGRIWDSTKASRSSIVGNYVPYLWVGGPLRGIAVFGENDRGWETVSGTPCQEIVREEDGTVKIVLNLVQSPVDMTEARTIRIGFQASPVKPMPDNWRSVGHGTLLGACYYWGGYTASESVEPFDGTDEFLRKMAEARQTGKVDEKYMYQAVADYPYTETPGTTAWTNKYNTILAHYRAGLYNAKWAGETGNLVFYTNGRGVHYGDASGQGATFCNEWSRYEYMNRAFKLSSSAAYDLDPVASYRDYAAWWYDRMLSTGAANHLYWDDVFCQSSFNIVQTDAYRLPNGRIQPSSGIFNMRALVKRCAVLQAEKGSDTRGNWVHMTNTALAPVLSFAGVNYDWEDTSGSDPMQVKYPKDYILACTIGRQMGNRVGIMGYFNPTNDANKAWLCHTGVGVMLTHELRWNASGHDEYVNAHKFLTDWGYRSDAVRVWNYWDEDEAYPLDVAGVENASIAMGKPSAGEAMVCVSSFSATNGIVRVRPDLEALGFNLGPWRVCHALTGEAIPVTDGVFEIPLDAYDWALVRIRAPRYVGPFDPATLPDGYDELVEFVEADGAQWIDTGISPNPKTTRIRARFVPLERLPASSSSDRIALYGVNGTRQSAYDWKNCNAMLGYGSDNGYQICPIWVGSSGGGYHYPGAGNYTVGKGYEIDFRTANPKSRAYVNGAFGCGGYNAKYDGNLGLTLFLGDINDAGKGLYTETVSGGWRRGKVRWLGFVVTDGKGRTEADFRPALRAGVAGFYETVSGKFFRSRGDGDFLSPRYVRWTGGMNFADGVVASVPPGVRVKASYADVAALNRLAGIRLEGTDSELVFTNGNKAATLLVPFSGKGRVVNSESNPQADCSLTFEGDSSFFAGTFLVTNAATAAKFAPYAFGVTNRVTVDNAPGGGSDKRRFRLEQATHSNEFHVVRVSNLFFGVNSATVAGKLCLDLPGGMTFHGNGQELCLSGPVETTVTNEASTVYLNANTYLTGGAAAVKSFARKRVQASNTVRLGCPLRFGTHPFSWTIYNNCNFSWNSGATVRFTLADVFDDEVFLLCNYAAGNASTTSSLLDLGGYGQRIGTLGVYCAAGFDARKHWNANLRIHSDAPAVLTVRKTCRNDSAADVFHGTLSGAVSLRLDSTLATPGAIRFNCPGSTTTGALEAIRGTIEVMATATFSNLTELVASGEGQLDIRTSEVGGADLCVVLTNSTLASGKVPLALASGCILDARVVRVTKNGKDRWLLPKNYTAADLPTLIGGEGTLKVRDYGGEGGLTLMIR